MELTDSYASLKMTSFQIGVYTTVCHENVSFICINLHLWTYFFLYEHQ